MIHNLKSQLFQIELEEVHGLKLRNKIKWDLDREKCTKTFFQKLETRKSARETMSRIIKTDGEMAETQQEILDEMKNFYQKLYTPGEDESQDELLQEEFLAKIKKKLTENQKKNTVREK